jgi:hypothetical protein
LHRFPLVLVVSLPAACSPYTQTFTVTWATFDASGEVTATGAPQDVERRAGIRDIDDSFIGFAAWKGTVDGADIAFRNLEDVQHPPYVPSDGGPPLVPEGTPTDWWPAEVPAPSQPTGAWDFPDEAQFSFSFGNVDIQGPPDFLTYELGDLYPDENPGFLIFGWPEAQVVLYNVLDDEFRCVDPEFADTPYCVNQSLGDLDPFDL